MSCQVCCANYNKSLHSEVKCYFENCGYSACKECIRTYFTGSVNEPHCMKCRNKWSLEFTRSSLNASFMDGDYKNHRRSILTDKVIAQIPEYYDGALRYGRLTEADKKMNEIQEQINAYRTVISQLYIEYENVRRAHMNGENSGQKATRKFVMQCQNNGCRGMLTNHYKCEICTKHTCSKCFIVIDEGHECKQEDIDTVEELRKNTRPCPKCGLRISKIDGCDQMWCVECKTAFSWAKGTIEQGVVHNPHYYQWMRQNGGVPQNPNDHNNGCGNIFQNAHRKISDIVGDSIYSKKYYNHFCENFENNPKLMNKEKLKDFYQIVKPILENMRIISDEIRGLNTYFTGFHRYITHTEHTELRPILNNIRYREEDHNVIYKYILNLVEKDELSDELLRVDNMNMRDRAFCDIMEALVVVGKQLIIDCMKELEEVNKLFPYSTHFSLKMDDIAHMESKSFWDVFFDQYVIFPPQQVEIFQKSIYEILVKYKKAISKYCAYSNIEIIKFLITYGSKRTLAMWNYEHGGIDHNHYKNKGEMVVAINEFQQFYHSDN